MWPSVENAMEASTPSDVQVFRWIPGVYTNSGMHIKRYMMGGGLLPV